jgi:hypothetical protein
MARFDATTTGKSYAEFVKSKEWWTTAFKEYNGKNALQIAGELVDKRNVLVADLKALPFADHIRVFGSSSRVPDGSRMPNDLDIFLDIRELHHTTEEEQVKVLSSLLRLMRSNFGILDAFVLRPDGILLCHSEAARPSGLSWAWAQRYTSSITKAGKAGIPLVDFNPVYAIPEDLKDDTAPTGLTR